MESVVLQYYVHSCQVSNLVFFLSVFLLSSSTLFSWWVTTKLSSNIDISDLLLLIFPVWIERPWPCLLYILRNFSKLYQIEYYHWWKLDKLLVNCFKVEKEKCFAENSAVLITTCSTAAAACRTERGVQRDPDLLILAYFNNSGVGIL